jgi:Suppressor of fused protein (SUFU)
MPSTWGSRTETGLTGEEFREEVQLHLARYIGEPHVAFSDAEGWDGKSKEPGPPVDVMVVPPEGERRFAYVCTFGASLKKSGDVLGAGGKARMEFALAAPQKGDPKADLAALNLAANTVRQFAKLVHLQGVRVTPGETVQFAKDPQPMFEGSKQSGFAFARPRLPADGFETMRLKEGEYVRFISPVPIYRIELELGRRKGPAALAKALETGGITEMLDMARRPVVKRSLFTWIADLFNRR